MCGRLVTSDPSELVVGWSETRIVPDAGALAGLRSFNLAPSRQILVIRSGPHGREIAPVRWGLVPSWAKDPSVGNKMFNARVETAAERPAFAAALRLRRCVALANGFFEWKREGARKVPYRITTAGPLMLAGLWEQWRGADGVVLESAAILTRAARPPLSALHDREPVLFGSRDRAYRWLDPRARDPAALLALLEDPGPELELCEASPLVNRVGNDGPECEATVTPVAAAQQTLW